MMHKQHGGTILGFILGLVTGLAVALGVAVYVTKVPLPFLSKGQTRSADQNESETKKNKDWDPNALIANKPAAKTPAEAEPTNAAEPAAKAPPAVPAETRPDTKPAAPTPTPEAKAAASADPIGALAKAKTAAPEAPQITFYVQVGAFRTPDDAERHRAKLALKGVDAKITERELSGRPVYRARVGPFDKLEDAETAKDKMDKLGIETALVKVQR
jgi:cell division protein FtsN